MAKKEVPKKEEKEKKPVYSKVDPIDRIPMVDYDEAKIIRMISDEKANIDRFRADWCERKLDYLRQWDDYLTYPSAKILEGQDNIHIPVTHEKLQAWHARMYKSIFSVDPMFTLEPLSMVNKDYVDATKIVLQWYLRNEINHRQGIKPFFDELLWDLGTDGWAIAYKRWETIERVMLDIEKIQTDPAREEIMQALGELKSKGKISKPYKEIERLVRSFSGVVVETVPHECAYFPDYIPTAGDLNRPKIVMVERNYSKEDLISYREQAFFDEKATNSIIEKGKGGLDEIKQEIQRERERLQGVAESQHRKSEGYPMLTCFVREDLKDVGFPQEYIFTVSLKAQKVARVTYLDRVCRDGNRPVYKFDLLKRPRSAYSRGFVELLYPLNEEVDEFHNFRRAAGKIANMPWGFYRASSGLEKEAIEVQPGKFYPVDDPVSDVRPMIFGNVTTWAMQEEQLAQSYADKLTSMPPMMQGQVPNAVGPLRSTSGVMALMNEAQTPLDVFLDRVRNPIGQLLSGILSDLQYRLPESVRVLILGEKGQLQYGDKGEILTQNVPKEMIMGNYKFNLAANDAQYNPERERQNAMAMLQLGLSQFPVQMGLTTPENAYWLMKDVYQKNGVRDIDKYLTQPQLTQHPLNLFQEYNSCLNGLMPMIVLNDDHKGKIEGLTALFNSPVYQEAKQLGNASHISDMLLNQAVQTHTKYAQVLESLQQMQAQEGSNQPVTVGARSTGQINPQGGPPAQGGQGGRERGVQGAEQSGSMAGAGQPGEAAPTG